MAQPAGVFTNELPVHGLLRDDLHRFKQATAVLLMVGIVCIFNGNIATLVSSDTYFHLEDYMNTHWVTTVFVFGGMSTWIITRRQSSIFVYIASTMLVLCLPVAAISFVADLCNIMTVANSTTFMGQPYAVTSPNANPHRLTMMIIYNVIDSACCIIALVAALYLLHRLMPVTKRHYVTETHFRSRLFAFCALIQSFLSLVKVILWICELIWLNSLSQKYLFINYTVDEPVWLAIMQTSGMLAFIVALRGTKLLMYVSYSLQWLALYPMLRYLLLDYRWLSSVKITDMMTDLPKQPVLLYFNIFVGVAHLLMTSVTLALQTTLIKRTMTTSILIINIKIDRLVRRAISICAILFFVAASAFLFSDLINLSQLTFFRAFFVSEQKMPILLFAASGLCTALLNNDFAMYAVPVTITVMLMTFHSTIFHISAFIYLAYNNYFFENACNLFFFYEENCNTRTERVGTIVHFFEASMALGVALLCLYVLVVLLRIGKMHQIRLGQMTMNEMKIKTQCEQLIQYMATAVLALGSLVLVLSINIGGIITPAQSATEKILSNNGNDHPQLVIHSLIYRTCLILSLIIYPLVTLYLSRNMIFYPINSLTISVLSVYRFSEVLTQLDNRNVGDPNIGVAWVAFSIVEFFALCAAFATICSCALTLDLVLSRQEQQRLSNDFAQRQSLRNECDNDSGIDVPRYSVLNRLDDDNKAIIDDHDDEI